MEDPFILISENKLSSINALLPLLEKVVQTGKPLLIIADDVEGEVMAASWSTSFAAVSRWRP